MRMTYKETADILWPTKGDVKILKTTEKCVFVECGSIGLRLRHYEIAKGAKIRRWGYREGSSYYIVIIVEEAET